MYFGFEIEDGLVLEYTPSIFKHFSKQDLFQMFFSQYNACVEKELRVASKSVREKKGYLACFDSKISFLLHDDSFKSCPLSCEIIRLYKQRNYRKLQEKMGQVPFHPAAKLISMIYSKTSPGLLFASEDFFSNYVFDKIQRRHPEKKVLFQDGFIIFKAGQNEKVGVMPSFKHMDTYRPNLANEDIKKAFEILEMHELTRLFIAYPKNQTFKKHMAVEHCRCSAKLTLVPYAISNKIVYNSKYKQ